VPFPNLRLRAEERSKARIIPDPVEGGLAAQVQ
jgi:hypothetical protein